MSDDYSDGKGSVGPDADFVDTTAETEVELRLPLEVDMKPDQPHEDIPTYSGAVDPDAVDLGQDEQRRFEPRTGLNRNGPDTCCRCLLFWNPVDCCRGLQRN